MNKTTKNEIVIEHLAITRRDYFAAAALQGLLANSFSDGMNQPLSIISQKEIAVMARDQVDHLINALTLKLTGERTMTDEVEADLTANMFHEKLITPTTGSESELSDLLYIVPITLKLAKVFIAKHHRHNKPPVGHKFSIGIENNGALVGVAVASRPSARMADDGLTLEVTRTCTDGTKNANSKLYGAIWRCAKAMGYKKCITYTQHDESGASLAAVGWLRDAELKPRKSWAESSGKSKVKRDPIGSGGVARTRWKIECV